MLPFQQYVAVYTLAHLFEAGARHMQDMSSGKRLVSRTCQACQPATKVQVRPQDRRTGLAKIADIIHENNIK